MLRIRELQPAHKSDRVTVAQAARAFKKIRTLPAPANVRARPVDDDRSQTKSGEQ